MTEMTRLGRVFRLKRRIQIPLDREEIRFGCIERATALYVRCGKGDVQAFAELFFEFVGEDPRRLRALDIALTRADYRLNAQKHVELAGEVMKFVNLADETNERA